MMGHGHEKVDWVNNGEDMVDGGRAPEPEDTDDISAAEGAVREREWTGQVTPVERVRVVNKGQGGQAEIFNDLPKDVEISKPGSYTIEKGVPLRPQSEAQEVVDHGDVIPSNPELDASLTIEGLNREIADIELRIGNARLMGKLDEAFRLQEFKKLKEKQRDALTTEE